MRESSAHKNTQDGILFGFFKQRILRDPSELHVQLETSTNFWNEWYIIYILHFVYPSCTLYVVAQENPSFTFLLISFNVLLISMNLNTVHITKSSKQNRFYIYEKG